MDINLLDAQLEGTAPTVECILLDDPNHNTAHVILRVSLDKEIANKLTEELCSQYQMAYTDNVRKRAYYYLALCHLVDKVGQEALQSGDEPADINGLMTEMMEAYGTYQDAIKHKETKEPLQ